MAEIEFDFSSRPMARVTFKFSDGTEKTQEVPFVAAMALKNALEGNGEMLPLPGPDDNESIAVVDNLIKGLKDFLGSVMEAELNPKPPGS